MFRVHKGAVYCEPIDDATLSQFKRCLDPAWSISGALMPDAHLGYGMPIGGVVKTDRVIVPSWVGYDIGCGVCTIPLVVRHPENLTDNKEKVHTHVNRALPMGFQAHKESLDNCPNPNNMTALGKEAFYKRGGYDQFGTLGGGNHFVELGTDSFGDFHVTIHSGSRGTGHEVGGTYMALASPDGTKRDGNYGFEKGTDLYNLYLKDMQWCLDYALKNRIAMLELIEKTLQELFDCHMIFGELVNKNHNHAEVHNDGTITHRKGATSAGLGEWGVIPGNMRDGVAIVRGTGNPDSLLSCSHGAGRRFSRGEAKRRIELHDFKEQMHGIVGNVSEKHIDESPDAYKDFWYVLEQQKDLCEVHQYIRPLINWKA